MTKKNLKELTRAITRMKRLSDILAQRLAEVKQKPAEINNYFGEGCNAQVFYGRVTKKYVRKKQKDKKTKRTMQATAPSQPIAPQLAGEQQVHKTGPKELVAGIKRTKAFMWGNAAYAVAFCVCRDKYGVGDNATAFERMLGEQSISIPAGTINAALHRNPWMRYHVDSWDGRGVQRRALKLRDEVQNQIANT